MRFLLQWSASTATAALSTLPTFTRLLKTKNLIFHNNIIVFKFQLRAHTKLIIPLRDHWIPTKVTFVFDIYYLFVDIPRWYIFDIYDMNSTNEFRENWNTSSIASSAKHTMWNNCGNPSWLRWHITRGCPLYTNTWQPMSYTWLTWDAFHPIPYCQTEINVRYQTND